MEGVTLLRQAREAGLAVAAEGEGLVIRGPRRAEPLARLLIEHKPEVLSALTSTEHPGDREYDKRDVIGDTAEWLDLFAARLAHWFARGQRRWHEAELIAFSECVLKWHQRHGRRLAAWRCAGCDAAIGGLAAALTLADGNRVHFDKLDCLLSFGHRWRSEAIAGLQALGLDPPLDFERP